MPTERTQVLDHDRVQRKLRRIAIQLYEENCAEPGLVVVGIAPRGHLLARRLVKLLGEIAPLQVELLELTLDKNDPLSGPVAIGVDIATLRDRTVVLVDDVLMSGRTLMHAAAALVQVPLRKLTTVVLVDRRHRTYPIRADIVGLTLSTTMQEHISVELGRQDAVYLS
ncbi:MAG: phosphoribosyltransferase family protein [Flavobacteriales bacterium]